MDEDKTIEVEAPIGADTEPENEQEQEQANEASLASNEFNEKLYNLVQEYQAKIPLNFMMKILTAVIIDLQSALLGTNIAYVTNKIQDLIEEKLKSSESKISLV